MPDLLSYQAGSAGQPAFMLRARRARRVLWKAMHFIVCEGFFGKSRAGGAKRVQGGLNPQSCAALWAAGGSMGSNAFYSVRGFFGKAYRVPRMR